MFQALTVSLASLTNTKHLLNHQLPQHHSTETIQSKKDDLGPQSNLEEVMSAKLVFLLNACLVAAAPSLIPRQGDDGITYEQSCDDDKNPNWDDCTWTLP
jgi:hypothetical protein